MSEINDNKDTLRPINSMEDRWLSTNSETDAQELVEYMVTNPSREWLQLMNRAEKKEIKYWDVLVKNSDRIYESIAETTADEDGIVTTNEN